MITPLTVNGATFSPPLFCAPLAGFTHSAFRRLVADFGGYGALWTEMLAARQLRHEDFAASPYLKRRLAEGKVIYQLMVTEDDPLEAVIRRLAECQPHGIDINLACHAPLIRAREAGSRLFENSLGLSAVLTTVRRAWPGLLTAKIRLGHDKPGWQKRLEERVRIIEECGVDALVLHPRFFEDKFKRRARHEWLGPVASWTRLPIIANGDITGPESLTEHAADFKHAAGWMLGRMAVVRPWVFAAWRRKVIVDYAEVWQRFFQYACEDFNPETALGRIKAFTKYYARNFRFGHTLFATTHNAADLNDLRTRAEAFFSRSPDILPVPSLLGL